MKDFVYILLFLLVIAFFIFVTVLVGTQANNGDVGKTVSIIFIRLTTLAVIGLVIFIAYNFISNGGNKK